MRTTLIRSGYEVWSPELPNNHIPNRSTYNDFLLESGWDFSDNLLVGHSSGTTAILNLLMDERCPKVKTAVMVSTFVKINPNLPEDAGLDDEQFTQLFPEEGFDWNLIKSKCENFYFVHGDNDPLCPIAWAQEVCELVGGKFMIIPRGHHIGGDSGITELPNVIEQLQNDHVL